MELEASKAVIWPLILWMYHNKFGFGFFFLFETKGRQANAIAQETLDHMANFMSSREEMS